MGIHYFSLFLLKIIYCVDTRVPTIYVFEQKYEMYQNHYLKTQVLVMKFSIYLNMPVFVIIACMPSEAL